jgi:predicted nucleic acid-binding protein
MAPRRVRRLAVPDAWDTSVASRAHLDARHGKLLELHLRSETPILLPAPTVQEITHGLWAHTLKRSGFDVRLRWFQALLDHHLVRVIPLDMDGSVLAGRLLALLPHPPTGRRRRDGARAQQRAAWALDVQIASCAFAGGYGVLTENVDDFAVLRDAIADLFPKVPPLVVADARPGDSL